ncbi:hypothetical protein LARI1_G000876 [Lachnellula arida]|uniref:DUF7728 domain-containing protein n=1 Tax=Lachnellula arida TaxID=1316785 RepID=A0A8T9BLT3_9HELO|nr:hypothetical protein LARI1_G000876 [Lachnellula arida]
MHFTTQLGLLAFAGSSRAFLLPPPTSSSSDSVNTLPFEDNIATEGRVMELNCPGCPVVVTDVENRVHFTDAESVLKFNLSVAHEANDGADQLLLNGLPIYPIDPSSQTFMTPLTADQMVKNADNTWSYVATPALGYQLSVKHPVQSEDQLDLVAMHIEIVEVANKFIQGIPSVELKLLETPSGKLMLGDAEITTPKSVSPEPTDDNKECATVVCKWRAIIAAKLSKLKGCGGKNRNRPAEVDATPANHHGEHARPHGRPHGIHRPFRHHRHRHSLGRFLKTVAVHVMIPVLIGIVVGITASLVGMIVGNIVIFVWRLLFRRNQARYVRVEQVEIIEEGDDENKSILESQGPPPTYTATDEKTVE